MTKLEEKTEQEELKNLHQNGWVAYDQKTGDARLSENAEKWLNERENRDLHELIDHGVAEEVPREFERGRGNITIGGESFPRRKDLKNYVRNIKDNHKGRRLPQKKEEFIREILKAHPKYSQKVGIGIDHITVAPHSKYGSYCFHVVHPDGTKTDFSYNKCVKYANKIRRRYYVYAIVIEEEPVYIGKGCNDRWIQSLIQSGSDEKMSAIYNAYFDGKKVKSKKLWKNLTEPQAFEIEKKLIEKSGKLNKNPGVEKQVLNEWKHQKSDEEICMSEAFRRKANELLNLSLPINREVKLKKIINNTER